MGTNDKVTQLHQYGKGGWQGTHKRIHLAIVEGEEFKAGQLTGASNPGDVLFGLGQLPEEWRQVFKSQNVDYVVFSYATPIAWHVTGLGEWNGWVIPDVRYSVTTSRHQGFARVALAIAGPVESLDDERLR